MSQLFETIRISNGIPRYLYWHEQRMNRARKEFWNITKPIFLEPVILIPTEFSNGLVRCNLIYGPEIISLLFTPYLKHRITSLRLVACDQADYHVKYRDRSLLHSLYEQRGECDEIIIVKEGFLTDSSMSNLIFFDGVQWVTPSNPLLRGTCRERLLSRGTISERPIRPTDLDQYQGLKLINAMRDPEEEEFIPIKNIRSN